MHPEIFVTVDDHQQHAVVDVSQHLAASGRHGLALTESGDVLAFGQLRSGEGPLRDLPAPAKIEHLGAIIAVGAGSNHELALEAGALLAAWGDNRDGQLGADPSLERTRLLPGQISDITSVVKICGGAEHSLALTDDRQVHAWGSNDTGQLGTATPVGGVRHTPRSVGLSGIRNIAAGAYHSLAIDGARA
ncbi:MAG: hypothetical protein KC457_17750, partial [Myxococcales bacterium]|nr:hypothetical protein [Myxococcales bacterium]